jgi:hypothetical protein
MHVPQAEIGGVTLFTEENQNIIFLQLTKHRAGPGALGV